MAGSPIGSSSRRMTPSEALVETVVSQGGKDICGIVGALAISAFPFTSGFISKSMISQAAADEQRQERHGQVLDDRDAHDLIQARPATVVDHQRQPDIDLARADGLRGHIHQSRIFSCNRGVDRLVAGRTSGKKH